MQQKSIEQLLQKSNTWPLNYSQEFMRRTILHRKFKKDPALWRSCISFYRENPVQWITDFCVTYNPRNKSPNSKLMPFLLFDRQKEFVEFILECLRDGEDGLAEKCRDVGLTWLCCAISLWLWLFVPGSAIGWGSRKEALVDRLGDPDSIFEKMRIIIRHLPPYMMPLGFNMRIHGTHMKFINPENGSSITGEAGDNIGRGGRSTIFFKDESAHYERPELIEASLGDNTDVQIDISSVRGTGNVFYRRRHAGVVWHPDKETPKARTKVFIFDWRDHPGKDQEWYDKRRDKAERMGLLHILAQEVDRDYTASMEGIVIPQIWVKACVDAHKKLRIDDDGEKLAGLDVADEGGDKNAIAARYGVILKECQSWGQGDTGETARKGVNICSEMGIKNLQYDSVGVGAGVKAETNRLKKAGDLPKGMVIVPWGGGESVLDPDDNMIPYDDESPLNKDHFSNLKAQGWWSLRTRVYKTYKAIVHGHVFPHEDMISISSEIEEVHELCSELSQATFSTNGKGKIVIDKKPDGSKSPNRADSVVICYFPKKPPVDSMTEEFEKEIITAEKDTEAPSMEEQSW